MYVVMEQLYVVKKIVVILAVNYHVLNLMKMSARKPMMTSTMMMMLSMTMMIWTTKTTMRMMLWMATMMTMIWRKKLLW